MFDTVSKDKTLKIIELIEMKTIFEINNLHSEQINYINVLKNKNFISCSDDKNIIIFTINLKKKNFTIINKIKNAHNFGILKVIEVNKNKLLSISFDCQIIFWEFNKLLNEYYKSFFIH